MCFGDTCPAFFNSLRVATFKPQVNWWVLQAMFCYTSSLLPSQSIWKLKLPPDPVRFFLPRPWTKRPRSLQAVRIFLEVTVHEDLRRGLVAWSPSSGWAAKRGFLYKETEMLGKETEMQVCFSFFWLFSSHTWSQVWPDYYAYLVLYLYYNTENHCISCHDSSKDDQKRQKWVMAQFLKTPTLFPKYKISLSLIRVWNYQAHKNYPTPYPGGVLILQEGLHSGFGKVHLSFNKPTFTFLGLPLTSFLWKPRTLSWRPVPGIY